MRVLGVRGYQMTPYGKQAVGEAWADAGQIADAFSDLFKRLPERKEHDADKLRKSGKFRSSRGKNDRCDTTKSNHWSANQDS